MKHIEPIYIWKNGVSRTASILDAIITNDNLQSSCTFYWMLKEELNDEAGENLAEGNCTMTGEHYDDWDGSNDYAFEYIAAQINVTLE
jgi:hypothetical protein